jgi:hypothetical protein
VRYTTTPNWCTSLAFRLVEQQEQAYLVRKEARIEA